MLAVPAFFVLIQPDLGTMLAICFGAVVVIFLSGLPLRWFIGAPELHHWHHDLDRRAGNYANISPLMDLAFGTYKCPNHEPEAFGIDEQLPKNYVGQMLQPLVKWRRYTAGGAAPEDES